MKLTKFGHACWHVEKDGRRLVIDPGSFSGTGLIDGADAILITHEHFDHLDPEVLRAAPAGMEVWTCQAVADKLAGIPATVHAVRHGDTFMTAGFTVRTVGEWHAPVHPDVAIIQNVGFFVDEQLFYPGDALTPPGGEVPTLLLPTSAPWLRLYDMVEYLRSVHPARAYSTHDGMLNEIGHRLIDGWLESEGDKLKADVRRIHVGDDVEV
ncbi:MBL fold metallo-hydrolase [Acrocarpospora phusangensis]|uniref:MBL fold metallo-hydrolase n=1 Tax=Acrocarpospora phusangensis TaxID=1070424 RepID=A0A919QE27_9ACTN|nr:MBL fold metallo-hydrolase [Acrocarpospora phusangensis]GIH24865.1 MBL fold metallo-hydrolase [Acrocarpospora phusangensis]